MTAHVLWQGRALGHPVRVVSSPDGVEAQTLFVRDWGRAPSVLGTAALSEAALALSAPPAPNPGLSVYLDLEQRALAADGQDEALAEAYRSVMDGAWNTHLSASDRRWLNARGTVGSPAGPVPGREDGNRKA